MPVRVLAFLIHLAISVTVFSTAFFLSVYLWYPDFYYSANGVWQAVKMVVLVDVVLGPVLTLVLYKPGKPGLKFDLTMIALFQIAALAWGVYVLVSQRPVLTVFDKGSYYCLNPELAAVANADVARFQRPDLVVPQAILPLPASAEEAARRTQIQRQAPKGIPSTDAFLFGAFFQPPGYRLDAMLHYELAITDDFLSTQAERDRWQAFLRKHPEQKAHFAYFSMYCSAEDHIAAVDRRTGVLIDAVRLPALRATQKRFLKPKTEPAPASGQPPEAAQPLPSPGSNQPINASPANP